MELTGFPRADRAGLVAMRDQLKAEIARLQKALNDVEKKLAALEKQPDADFLPRRRYDLSEAGSRRIGLAARLRGLKTHKKQNATQIAEIEAELARLKPIVDEERRRRMNGRHRRVL